MIYLTIALTSLLCFFAFVQIVITKVLHVQLSKKPIECPPSFAPKTAVILSLRGADPFLADGIQALRQQEFPNFLIKIVVDSEEDPSWKILKSIDFDSPGAPVEIQVLRNRRSTCSLKCSALVEAVESMDDDVEIIVLTDADVVSNSRWLHDSVGPLSNPKIGVVTGNQWFAPDRISLGSMVRSYWHSGSISPTVVYEHPWGGTCAMRVDDIKKSGLVERWKKTIVDDGPIKEAFNPLGLKVYVSPSLVIVNRENCSFDYARTYIRRMLTWSRIYEDAYWLTLLHMFGTTGPLLLLPLLAVYGVVSSNPFVAWSAAIGIFAYVLSTFVGFWAVESSVKAAVRNRNQSFKRTSLFGWIRFAFLFPFVHLLHSIATIEALLLKRISWRKVTYEIRGRWNVKVIKDQPYVSSIGSSEKASV